MRIERVTNSDLPQYLLQLSDTHAFEFVARLWHWLGHVRGFGEIQHGLLNGLLELWLHGVPVPRDLAVLVEHECVRYA